jgi:protein SCO1/2
VLVLSATSAAAADVAEVNPQAGARLPLALRFQDETGRAMTLGQALDGHPAVLVFADWTCNALCGTTLGQAAMVLQETRLRPGRDYEFLAIGIDPRDTLQDASAMKSLHLSDTPALRSASHFLSGDAATIRAATEAMGFHAVYLPDQDQFSHPAALLLLAPDGRLTRVLPSFMLEPEELRADLAAASSDAPTTSADSLAHRVLLVCHAVLTGKYGAWVPDVLRAGGVATMLCLACAFVLLTRKGRRS